MGCSERAAKEANLPLDGFSTVPSASFSLSKSNAGHMPWIGHPGQVDGIARKSRGPERGPFGISVEARTREPPPARLRRRHLGRERSEVRREGREDALFLKIGAHGSILNKFRCGGRQLSCGGPLQIEVGASWRKTNSNMTICFVRCMGERAAGLRCSSVFRRIAGHFILVRRC